MRPRAGLALLPLALVAGLAGAEEWYDAYREGVRALAQGRPDAAVAPLERADRAAARARTQRPDVRHQRRARVLPLPPPGGGAPAAARSRARPRRARALREVGPRARGAPPAPGGADRGAASEIDSDAHAADHRAAIHAGAGRHDAPGPAARDDAPSVAPPPPAPTARRPQAAEPSAPPATPAPPATRGGDPAAGDHRGRVAAPGRHRVRRRRARRHDGSGVGPAGAERPAAWPPPRAPLPGRPR